MEAQKTYSCKSCSSALFDSPNQWLALGNSRHIYLPPGLSIGKIHGVRTEKTSHPGSKSLESCTVRSLQCKECTKAFGLHVTHTPPEKRTYRDQWFIKRTQTRVEDPENHHELHVVELPKTQEPLDLTDRPKILSGTRVASISGQGQPLDHGSTPKLEDVDLKATLVELQTLVFKQNEVLVQLASTMAEVKEEMVSLRKQFRESADARKADQAASDRPSRTGEESTTVDYPPGMLKAMPNDQVAHSNLHTTERYQAYGTQAPNDIIPSSQPQGSLKGNTTPNVSAHDITKTSDVVMADAPVGSASATHTAGFQLSEPLTAGQGERGIASKGGGFKHSSVVSQILSDPHLSIETQEYLEKNLRNYDPADSDFSPTDDSQDSQVRTGPTFLPVEPAIGRFLTPVRPLEVNKNSNLSRSPRAKRALAQMSFASYDVDPDRLGTPYWERPGFDRDRDYDPRDPFGANIDSSSRGQSIRRRGVSSGSRPSGASPWERRVETSTGKANGALMTHAGKQGSRILRGKMRPSINQTTRILEGGSQVPSSSSVTRRRVGNRADALAPNSSSSGTAERRHSEVMAMLKKGQRSELAQSRVLRGYEPVVT